MNNININKILISALFWLLTGSTFSQNKTSAHVSIDKNKILIGERINLTLEADIAKKETIRFFSIDSLPHFEIVSKGKIDTSKTANGITLKQNIQLTSFDSGHWVIPPFILDKKIKTDPVIVDVVFSDFDPSKDYHDLKGIIEINPASQKNKWWRYIIAGTIILITVIVWVLISKKKPKTSTLQSTDPFKDAMTELQLIQKKNLSDKQYYSALVDIFRLYIFRKKGILSLQETTGDFIDQLKRLNLNKDLSEQLSQALKLSDFVKFAKYTPAVEDNKTVFETIKKAIQTIESSNV